MVWKACLACLLKACLACLEGLSSWFSWFKEDKLPSCWLPGCLASWLQLSALWRAVASSRGPYKE